MTGWSRLKGQRDDWAVAAQSRWHIQWLDRGAFKIEHEGDSLTDKLLEEWGAWMDLQIYERFGDRRSTQLVAISLNLSWNGLDDQAVQVLVEYLLSRSICVQILKLHRNSISDGGAWALGHLLAHSELPILEVHLSHNHMTEQGALAILECIARSGRYPFQADKGVRRDERGRAPVWLRLEHNNINWIPIDHRLAHQTFTFSTADSRDGWTPKDCAPMVCMHNSYRNQAVEQVDLGRNGGWGGGLPGPPPAEAREAPNTGSLILAALQGDGAAKQSLDAQLGGNQPKVPVPLTPRTPTRHQPGNQPAPPPARTAPLPAQGLPAPAPPRAEAQQALGDGEGEDVPLYVFLDAGAVVQMMTREDGVFSFRGLLSLCQCGHMKCTPPDQRPLPAWMGPVEEYDCVMLVVTDVVMEELAEWAKSDPSLRARVEWLRNAPDSYLQRCLEWGIVEVLETQLHTQLLRLDSKDRQMAHDMRIPWGALKMLDFACLWGSQIRSRGRVLLVTTSGPLCELGDRLSAGERFPPVLHIDTLNRKIAEDKVHGGQVLGQVILRPPSNQFAGAMLSATLLARVTGIASLQDAVSPSRSPANGRGRQPAESDEVRALKQAVQEAIAIVGSASRCLRDPPGNSTGEAAQLTERMIFSIRRWQALLDGQAQGR